ncbi:Protein FAR1-RELATED SEQUENCE 11 [Bienertia sinuspersici]
MITTGRSKSVNASVKRFVSSHISLIDFVKQLHVAVEEISQGRSYNKMIATLRPISLNTKSPLEKQAFEVLTPFAFKKFQEEFSTGTSYTINQVDSNAFMVKYFERNTARTHKVFWDGQTMLCSYKNFKLGHNLSSCIAMDDDILAEEECTPLELGGRPKNKRENSGKELGMKKSKCCSICKQPGHTKPTCPIKENLFTLNVDEGLSSMTFKRSKNEQRMI